MELLERETQLKMIQDAWRRIEGRQGGIVLVSGEAGIGKTSIIQQFVSEQSKTARVLWGMCDALFTPRPLGPFIDIAIQVKSDLFPLIQSKGDQLSFSTALFLELKENPAPTIMILEDLHWADEATLDVLKFLGRRIQQTSTLLILSYRDDEINIQHPLSFLLGDFPAHLTTRVSLPRLSESAVAHLARKVGRSPEGLHRATDGNPFFVSEIIASDSERIPPSVRDAVLSRVARLTPTAKFVVEIASLMPGAAQVWIIEDILHPDPGSLDECMERGILHPDQDCLVFRHELARQSVEDSLPIGKTRELHGKILDSLMRREGEQSNLTRLVHHAARSGDEEATLRFAPQAARQASTLGAHREAASLYKISLSFIHHLPEEMQADLLEGLSFEYYLIGNIQEAIQTRKRAVLIWKRLERSGRAGDCTRWLSRLFWVGGKTKEAEKYADQAIEILSAMSPGQELAMAYSNKSQLHMLAEENDAALEWGNRALALAKQLDAREIYVHALTNMGTAEIANNRFEIGIEQLKTALFIAREHEMHDHVSRCYANIVSIFIQTRQYTKSKHWLEEGLEYTTARDIDMYTSYLLGWKARMNFEMGHWADAEHNALEALRLSGGESIIIFPATAALAHLKVRQGAPDAGDFLEQAYAVAISSRELQRIAPISAARAEAAWWRNDRSRVAAEALDGYHLALLRNNHWALGPLAYWMWRVEAADVPIELLPKPYAWMILGDWQRAAQAWEQVGCPYEQALALSAGDETAQLQALKIFNQLGAGPAADALHENLRLRRPAPPAPRESGGLTSRELEVLQLMAQGMSNPSVAEKLTISVGTVKAHTGSIYSKLGVNNRVQALSRARELHLL